MLLVRRTGRAKRGSMIDTIKQHQRWYEEASDLPTESPIEYTITTTNSSPYHTSHHSFDVSIKLSMIDNLKYNREQARTAKEDVSHGFAFAIQPNGCLLGDESHAKRKRQRSQGAPKFTFMSSHDIAALPRGRNAPLHPPPQNCLATVQQLMQEAAIAYQKQTKLPAVPEPKASTIPNYQTSTPFATSSSSQPLREPIIQSNQNHQPQPHATTSATTSNHNTSYTSSNNSNYQNTYKSGSASPPRKENQHPNRLNPPTGNSYNNRDNNNNATIVIDDGDEFIDTNDDFDDVLANFDVDEAVRGRNSMESNATAAHGSMGNNGGTSGTFDYDDDYGASNHGNNHSFGSSSGPVAFNAAPYHDATSARQVSNYDSNVPNYGGTENASSYQNQSNYAMNADEDNSNAPLCPEHNLPCRLLTAKSASNMGRQFYKCSLPEGQQCDFFQWADGMEGNWNESALGPIATGSDTKDMYQENQRIFGHRSFRPGQKEVIEKAIQGRDVFVLMPTGGGKSLCYQLPAWCCPGLAVVISPLLSLIQDQVQSMTKVGVQSVFLSSKQDYDTEQREITERLGQLTAHGGIKILYLTPEKLAHSTQMQRILKRLYQQGLLSRFVVDEAHCLSDWGHDFRPDYNNLGMLRREFPKTPLMALTATANEKVVNDAIRALGMRNHHLYRSSFNRKNLHYEVRKKDGKVVNAIAEYIASRPNDSGVVYCLSRKNCEDVSEKLQKMLHEQGHRNVRVSFYHAELDQRERDRRHHAWSIGQISVLCATIAFGMGIDKPGMCVCQKNHVPRGAHSRTFHLFASSDVRYVIHYSMPKSITH